VTPISATFQRLTPDGGIEPIDRQVPDETPIAIEYNGIGYAVLMASGQQLDDLVTGFSLAERIVERAAQIEDILVHPTERGIILRAQIAPGCMDRVVERVRHRVSESSCGLCGIENLEQALRLLPRLPDRPLPATAGLFRALGALAAHQPLNARTGAVHAAALCSGAGDILLVREDVGRHNAFDKLIGAMARGGMGWDGGFALLTSRCSYELVEKAVLADCPLLVTVSAATGLAIDRAAEANLPLVVLARADAMLLSDAR
jgi:FdhD protein